MLYSKTGIGIWNPSMGFTLSKLIIVYTRMYTEIAIILL